MKSLGEEEKKENKMNELQASAMGLIFSLALALVTLGILLGPTKKRNRLYIALGVFMAGVAISLLFFFHTHPQVGWGIVVLLVTIVATYFISPTAKTNL